MLRACAFPLPVPKKSRERLKRSERPIATTSNPETTLKPGEERLRQYVAGQVHGHPPKRKDSQGMGQRHRKPEKGCVPGRSPVPDQVRRHDRLAVSWRKSV